MSDAHPYREPVGPMGDREPRPLWSVMIPTYNCASYLRETLSSVLAQDPGPEHMQIEVVDDASTADDPQAVVRALAGERVSFYRQPENMGHVRNFNTCLQRSRGQLVHLLHGDDRVRQGFYATMQRPFLERAELGAAFCRHICMDEAGHWLWLGRLLRDKAGVLEDAVDTIGSRQPILTPSMVVRRSVYERLGGFDRRMKYCGEDWEMWVRIAASYAVWYEPVPLAEYRRHAVSLTARSLRSGDNIRDIRRAVHIYRAYLPATSAAAVTRAALELSATWGTNMAGELLMLRNRHAALAQLREALRCSRSPVVLAEIAKLVGNGLSFWARRGLRAVLPVTDRSPEASRG